jgi:hypothetical protein
VVEGAAAAAVRRRRGTGRRCSWVRASIRGPTKHRHVVIVFLALWGEAVIEWETLPFKEELCL